MCGGRSNDLVDGIIITTHLIQPTDIQLVDAWIRKASNGLELAKVTYTYFSDLCDTVAFNCQQAAEKQYFNLKQIIPEDQRWQLLLAFR